MILGLVNRVLYIAKTASHLKRVLEKRCVAGSGKSSVLECLPVVYNPADIPDPALTKRDFRDSQILQDKLLIAIQLHSCC